MANIILLPLFAIFTSIFSPIAAECTKVNISISGVYNFGGSSSDTGGLISSAVYRTLNPPYGQNYFNYSTGRFSDGRIVIDFLMEAFGLPFLNPYLDSVGAPNFRKGCNFAAGGSTIVPPTLPIASPFPFRVQVSQFLRFKSRVMELLSKDKNVDYLPKESDFSNSLFMFDIGHNDLIGAFNSKTFDQIIEYIPVILAEFEAGINRLYDNGARNFWIHNTDPIGCLALAFHKFGNDPSKLDEMGCVSLHNQAARMYNDQLYSLVQNLQAQHPNAYFSYVDMYTVKANLIANYSRYGFKQVIMACCGFGGPPLNHDPRISCGQTKIVDGTLVRAEGCAQSSEYVSWDGSHYTEAASQIIASQILTGRFSNPPFHLKIIE